MALSPDVSTWTIPTGVDRETAFKIEVKVDGFWNKQDDSKKVYVKGRILQWIVDSDKFSICNLKSYLLEDLSWGRLQTPKIWLLDQDEGTKAKLEFESQIPDMFKLCQKKRVVYLHVQVCDTNTCTSAQQTPDVPVSNSDDEYALDDNGYIGDEYMYISDGDVGLQQEAKVNLNPIKIDNVHGEPTMDDVGEHEPIMTQDLENPTIEVDATFPDVVSFRMALRQFAMKALRQHEPN